MFRDQLPINSLSWLSLFSWFKGLIGSFLFWFIDALRDLQDKWTSHLKFLECFIWIINKIYIFGIIPCIAQELPIWKAMIHCIGEVVPILLYCLLIDVVGSGRKESYTVQYINEISFLLFTVAMWFKQSSANVQQTENIRSLKWPYVNNSTI